MDHSNHPRPILWKERNFQFPKEINERTGLIGHLSTFPSQCSIVLESIDQKKMKINYDDKWSIQEHLGHLLDLDDLSSTRIDEIKSGKDVLSPADMQNRMTWSKNYNDENIYSICERFMERRNELVTQLNSVPDDIWLNSAYHERLDRKMTVLDLAYFQSQHDLYHQEMMLYLAGR